jgi:hypothetical protein
MKLNGHIFYYGDLVVLESGAIVRGFLFSRSGRNYAFVEENEYSADLFSKR